MKKIIALLCVICIGASLFAGCGFGKKGGDAEILWYVPGDAQPDQAAVMEEVNKIVKEKLGVTLNIQFIPQSAYSERMKMIMASGAEYDLCFTSNWLNNYKQAVDNAALYDMTELVEQNPEMYDVVPKRYIEGSKIDGKLYAFPNMQIMAQPLAVYARKDLLEKYDFDLQSVEHIRDIEPFLESVKKGEKGIYPFRTKWGPAFWVNDKWAERNAIGLWFNYETHEFKPRFEVPEYVDHVNTFRDWYKKGYIRADVASAGDDTTDSKQNKYAVQMSGYKPGQVAPDNQTNCEYDYKVLLTLPMSESCATATMTGISVTSKNPEKAFEVIKLVNTDKKLYNLICNGIEGKHYKLNEEGKIIPDETSGYCPDVDWEFGSQFNALIDEGMPDDVWEQTKVLNESTPMSPLSGFTYDDTETALDISNLRAVMDEYNDYTTPADFESYKKNYEAKMKDAGADRVYADIEKQIKAYLKEKGIKPQK